MSSERRLTHRLVDYWQEIKGDNILPSESDIDPEQIPDMWDHCFFIQVGEGNEDLTRDGAYSYSFLGHEVAKLFVHGEEGSEGHVVSLDPEKLTAMYTEMLMTKLPIVEEVEEFLYEGKNMRYRQCILPMGLPNGSIKGIFGGMRYKLDD